MSIQEAELNNIFPGLSLGVYTVIPTRTQLFMFSAITWNRHQIHFNRDQAQAEGLADVAVQRGLLGNFLAQYVSLWMPDKAELRNLKWKVLKSAFPDEQLKCMGEVVSVDSAPEGKDIFCSLRIVNKKDDLIAEGHARLQFLN